MPGRWIVQDRDGRTIYMTEEQYYDSVGDILYITFVDRPGRGLPLTPNIRLRIDPETGQVLKLIIHDFAVLTAMSLNGHRSFPLTATAVRSLSAAPQVNAALQQEPVSRFLQIAHQSSYKRPRAALSDALLHHEPVRPT